MTNIINEIRKVKCSQCCQSVGFYLNALDSVPSERLFSKAGQLVSERRNRLKPSNVDMLLFLNNNLH